ncbi:STAS domain-containing protein [Dyella jejuensis]|uniref:STAS domain-containing protein n=1 Tax=Dyella jejuensis TaxID=1432009 RepID=A0ABW8JKW6_9GAMM
MASIEKRTTDIIRHNESELLQQWRNNLEALGSRGDVRSSNDEFHKETSQFLHLFVDGLDASGGKGLSDPSWDDVRAFLEALSHNRAVKGFDSQETAGFIFSLKKPLFPLLQQEYAKDQNQLIEQLWEISGLIDALGLHTVRTYQKSREAVIKRQQEELLELSTPVVKLWDGVLALPMIGTLDSQRTQVVMESLLQRIADTGSEIAIIDITGVPTVDTLVAQHLLKTVTAIRLMGADCIISGVRPQIAQTIVHLGLDLQGVITKANLADALALALGRTGFAVSRKV